MLYNIFPRINIFFIIISFLLTFSIFTHAEIGNDKVLLKRFNANFDAVLNGLPQENIALSDLSSIKERFKNLQADHRLLTLSLKRLDEDSDLNNTLAGDIETLISALNDFYYRSELLENNDGITSIWHELVREYHFYSILWNLSTIRNDIKNRHHFILHNRLPVNPSELFDNKLSIGNIQASYKTQTYNPTAQSEFATNAKIVNKARELNNDPIAIYAFVASVIQPEIYAGSRKGAVATLITGSGNDIDQALLLQALLNAAGFESSLVTGIIKAPLSYLSALWNTSGDNNLLRLLRVSGQKFELPPASQSENYILWQHTWVSASVPYDSYRGAEVEKTKRSWIALDPYQAIDEKISSVPTLPAETDIDALWSQHLTQGNGESFFQVLSQKTITNNDTEQVTNTENITVPINYLPASLPFITERVIHEGPSILPEYDNRIRMEIIDNNGLFNSDILSHEFSIAELYNRNVSVSFEGATPEDQQTLLRNGGINNTLLSDVRLKMVIRIDNQLVALSDEDVSAGDVLTLRFTMNNTSNTQFEKNIIAGSFYSLGIGGGAVIEDSSQFSDWPNNGAGIRLLSQAAYRYLNNIHKDNLALAHLFEQKLVYPQPIFTFVSNANRIDYLIDQPVFLDWTGVEMDALFQSTASVNAKESTFSQAQFLNASALNSSWHEQETFETLFELNSISADEAIAIAFKNGNLLVNPSPEAIAATAHNNSIKNALLAHINAGQNLYVIKNPLTVDKWSGAAWVATDPLTGASGYYLSGGIAGAGNTALDGNENTWALIDPESTLPAEGSDKVARIVAFYDYRSTGIAGQTERLRIIALTDSNAPVVNAEITLEVTTGNAGLGRFTGSTSTTYTALTDNSGYVTSTLTFSQSTAFNSGEYYEQGELHSTRMAEVRVNAFVGGTNNAVHLDFPIVKYVGPDQPIDGTIKIQGPNIYAMSLDQYGNPVSNIKVTVRANGIKSSASDYAIDDFGNGQVGFDGHQGTNHTGTTRSKISFIASIYPGEYCDTEYKFNVSMESGPSEELIREKCTGIITGYLENLEEIVEENETICSTHLTRTYSGNGTPKARHILTAPNKTQNNAIVIHTRMCEIHRLTGVDTDTNGNVFHGDAAVWEVAVDTPLPNVIITSPTGSITSQQDDNDFIISVTGTTPGEHNIQYTDDFTYGGGADITVASYFTVLPQLALLNEIYTREISPGNFVTSRDIQLSYNLLGAPSILGKQPLIILYEEENPVAVFYSQTISPSGVITIPLGTRFDDETHEYFAELVVYQGYSSTEVRSEKIPLLGRILKGTSRQVLVQHESDLSNGIIYKETATDFIVSLGTSADVTIHAQRIMPAEDSETNGPTVPTYDELDELSIPIYAGRVGRGKNTLELDFSELEPGEYHLSVRAVSADSFNTGFGGATLNVKINKANVLPIAHAIYDNVDLHDGSLNLRRQDLSIPLEELSLSFSRQYNSSVVAESYLGVGWSDLNKYTLNEAQNGTFNANGIRFEKVGDSFKPLRGYHGTLIRRGDDFDFFSKAGVKYHYRQYAFNNEHQWSVEYIQPVRGPSIRYSYLTDDLKTPRIASIEDGYDRKLVYSYETYESQETGKRVQRISNVELKDKDALIEFSYDSALRLESVTLTKANQSITTETYEYEIPEFLTYKSKIGETEEGEAELEENRVNINQQNLAKLMSITDAKGYTTEYTYDEEHLPLFSDQGVGFEEFVSPVISTIKDKRGTITNFDYNYTTDEYEPSLSTVASTVTISGTSDDSEWTIEQNLNGYGSIIAITDAAGTETTEWDEDHLLPSTVINRRGHTTTFVYDESGNLIERAFSLNNNTVTEISEYTELFVSSSDREKVFKTALINRTDGAGRVITYEFQDSRCPFPTHQNYPEKTFSYDDECRLISKVDTHGNLYQYQYGDDGYRSMITGPEPEANNSAQLSEKYIYNAFGEITQTKDFDSLITTYINDIFGNPLTITKTLGHETILTYDKLGRKKTATDAIGRTTTFGYDEEGNLTSEERLRGGESGDQLVTRILTYTERNQLETEQDWNGNITTYEYDDANRLEAILSPLGKRTTYGLDNNGNRETESYTIQSGRTATITRTFNEQNQLSTETDAEGEIQTWEYDNAGNPLNITAKNGLITSHEYDDYNRKISTTQNGSPLRKTSFEYDLNGWLTTQTEDPSGNERITSQRYDELGRVIETVIRQDNDRSSTISSYNPLGNLLSQFDPVGAKIRNEYDSLYRLKTSYNALDEETHYEYDLAGRLLEQRNPNGNTQTFAYNASDLNTLHKDTIGLISQSKYDVQGNLKAITDGRGNTSRYQYNELHQQTTHTLATDGIYKYTYNHQGQILTETDPLQAKRTLTYNKRGDLLTEQDFNRHTSTYTRDSLGNPKTLTDALGHLTQYEYNDYGELSTITDPLFNQLFKYDTFGRRIKSTDQRGIETRIDYNFLDLTTAVIRDTQLRQANSYYPDGQLSETFDGESNRTFFEYDALKRTTLESGTLLAITQYQHDTAARTRKIISPVGVTTDETYDKRGNLKTTTTDGAQTEFEYDLVNNQKRMLLPEGNDVNYTFDALNRLETITDGENNITGFVFDDIGLKRSHTDGKGTQTDFDYDDNGNLTSINYAGSLTTSFTYDAMNNRETQVLPAYGTLTYGYDALNRLTSQTDSTGTIGWTLDGNSNATQTDYSFTPARNGLSTAVETATYNNQDLRSQYTDIAGLTTQWRYNNNDLVEEITYPSLDAKSGDFTRFTFDARNRTASAIMKGGSVSYEYYNDDQLKKASYANGAESKYTYTPRNQVESIKHSINNALLSELGYTYDLNDNRKTETKNNGTGSVVTSYDFDDNDRIESIAYPAQYNEAAKTVAYQFDAANNREFETTTQDSTDVTKTYVYNDLDQLTDITSTNTEQTHVEYGYDDNGNLAQKRSSKTINSITQTETNDYAFDIRGQLKSVTMGGSNIGQFLYDDVGQRLRTQYNTLENGKATTQTHAQHSLYQGLKLISQYDISTSNQNDLSISANYQFAGGMNIGRRAYNEDDTANNTQTYYHTDALGSVLATSKANKSIAARYDYDVWGEELNNTDTSNNPIGYTGHQMDRESENKTGLIYANARYLDPDTGRFLSFDPFAGYDDKPISLNKYLYAYQNPVRYTDLSGRSPYDTDPLIMDQIRDLRMESEGLDNSNIDDLTTYALNEAIDRSIPFAIAATAPIAFEAAVVVNSVRAAGLPGLLAPEAQVSGLIVAEEIAALTTGTISIRGLSTPKATKTKSTIESNSGQTSSVEVVNNSALSTLEIQAARKARKAQNALKKQKGIKRNQVLPKSTLNSDPLPTETFVKNGQLFAKVDALDGKFRTGPVGNAKVRDIKLGESAKLGSDTRRAMKEALRANGRFNDDVIVVAEHSSGQLSSVVGSNRLSILKSEGIETTNIIKVELPFRGFRTESDLNPFE